MNFSKEDQNTFLMVITILVVSIITIVIVLNLVWSAIARPVEYFAGTFSDFFREAQPQNYNFEVSQVSAAQVNQNEQGQTQDNSQSEQFSQEEVKIQIPYREAKVLGDKSQDASANYIISKAIDSDYRYGSNPTQIKFYIESSKISLSSPAMSGSDAKDILSKGFYIYPGSKINETGQIVLICFRSQFESSDSRSCWNLDQLKIDDEIILRVDELNIKYKIVGENRYTINSDFIFETESEENYLKIITNTISDGEPRVLVHLAKKEDSLV